MSAAFVIANSAMALFDLGIAYAVYRVYRWASTPDVPAPRPARQPAVQSRHRHQPATGLADLTR